MFNGSWNPSQFETVDTPMLVDLRIASVATKRCGGCEEELPLERFATDRSKASGKKSRCRICCGRLNANWKALNQAHLAERARVYRTRNAHAKRQARLELRRRTHAAWWTVGSATVASRQLAALDPSLTLMPADWHPSKMPREPRPTPEQRLLTRLADQILFYYPEPEDSKD